MMVLAHQYLMSHHTTPTVPILLEAERWCVVAKPPGMMVHRNSFAKRGETVLLQLVRDQLGRHVHPVHRLDGGTSGCLAFAFDSEACAAVQAALGRADACKSYLAFVRGDATVRMCNASNHLHARAVRVSRRPRGFRFVGSGLRRLASTDRYAMTRV